MGTAVDISRLWVSSFLLEYSLSMYVMLLSATWKQMVVLPALSTEATPCIFVVSSAGLKVPSPLET